MGSRIAWAIGLGCCTVAAALAAESQSPAADGERKGWEQLHLRETTIAGTKVFYEPALEPNLPVIEQEMTGFSADRAKVAGLIARRSEIIADINRILGVTDPNLAEQEKLFSQCIGMSSQTKLTLYVVRIPTVKDFLRGGGQLPDCTYDRQTDSALYEPLFHSSSGAKSPETWEFWIPISPDKDFAGLLNAALGGLGQLFGSGFVDTAIHEVTEITLVHKTRPTPPYGRWFNDGVANAVAHRLVEKYLGREAAKGFMAKFDPNRYRDLEKEINLRYWLLGGFGIYLTDIPVEPEDEISRARYAYATLEAERLIDAHGIDCIRRILDKFAAQEDRRDVALLEVIKEVTGEDMAQRLLRYQTFTLTEDGISKYAQASRDAQNRQDMAQTFITQARLLELRSGTLSNLCLEHFLGASMLLVKMGHENAAEEAMQNCIRTYSKDTISHGREAALQAYIVFALNASKPRKAEAFADELLQAVPDHVNSLAVKMFVSAEDKNLVQARDYARRIQSLTKEGSAAYRAATKILGVDPNAPPVYKGPAEPNK